MAFITPTAEVTELGGGVFRNTIHVAPVAYQDASGNLQAISDQWNDGDATYPHVISTARLRVRTAPNGDRLLLPVPGDDDAWFSISSPFINVGGSWIQPSLGSFSRSGNQLTATAANVITRINHAGHYIKAEYELLNGWTPQNGQFAYRVGLQGLTRQGGQLLYNGLPVMQLRKPVVYDAANPEDTREIAHEFVTLNGQAFILFTLPDTTGMDRVVVDPTFTAQPDDSTGEDNYIRSTQATTNNGTSAAIQIGNFVGIHRGLLRFSLSSIPAGANISSATLSLYLYAESSDFDRTLGVYRSKRVWDEATSTWNEYSSGNSWATAGGFGVDDCEQTPIGTYSLSSTEAVGTKDISLTASTLNDLDYGLENAGSVTGWLLKVDTESSPDRFDFRASAYGTTAQRPKLTIEYSTGPAIPVVMHHRRTQGMS